jgi:hypothetical protein
MIVNQQVISGNNDIIIDILLIINRFLNLTLILHHLLLRAQVLVHQIQALNPYQNHNQQLKDIKLHTINSIKGKNLIIDIKFKSYWVMVLLVEL